MITWEKISKLPSKYYSDPQWNWSADPHRSQSADPLSGADLRAQTPRAGGARTPSGTGARTPTVARARTPEETSCPACWRGPRPVEFLEHTYATCAAMSELDKGVRAELLTCTTSRSSRGSSFSAACATSIGLPTATRTH